MNALNHPFVTNLLNRVPEKIKTTWKIRAFSLLKIPVIAFLGPSIVHTSHKKMILKIPMGYRARNHLNSMYLGVLAIGAELSVGLLALRHIEESGKKLPIVFKDMKMEFLKRAESDVHFVCEDGEKIENFIERVCDTEERLNETLTGYALAPATSGDEPVARFEFTLSLRLKR